MNTLPASTSTLTPTTPVAPARPKKLVSDAYARYLDSQEAAIRMKGGNDESVREFMRTELGEPTFAKSLEARTSPKAGEVDPYVPPHLQGISMAVLQGSTAGWGDEAIGHYRAKLTGLHPAYETDLYRREYEAWAKANLKTRFAAEMAGAIITGGIGGVGVKGVAAMGAVAGAGYTDGTLTERAVGALIGAPFAALISSGVGYVVKPIVKPILAKLTPKPAETLVGTTPEATGRERYRNAFIADGIADADAALLRATSIAKGGTPTTAAEVGGEAVNALIQEASRAISPVKNAAREAFRQRSAATGERLSNKLAIAMFGRPHFASANARELREQVIADANDMVRPMYAQAYQQMVELPPRLGRLLEEYPQLRKAYNNAATAARGIDEASVGRDLRGLPSRYTPGLKVDPLPDELSRSVASIMQRFPNTTEAVARTMLAKMPNMRVPLRAIDLMKRELDDILESEVAQKFPGMTEREIKKTVQEKSKVLTDLRDEFVQEARKQSPIYDELLSIGGDARALEESIELGEQFFRMHPHDIKKAIMSRPPILRDGMRIGVLEAFNTKISGTESSMKIARDFFGGQLHDRNARGFLLSPHAQRVAALFPDTPEMADEFLRTASGEALAAFRSGSIMRRPAASAAKKAEKLAEGQLPNPRGSALLQAASIARQQLAQASEAMSQAEADEIMHLATKGMNDPRDLYAFLQTILPRGRRHTTAFGAKVATPDARVVDRLRAGTRAAAGTLGGKIGGSIGAAIVPNAPK